MKHGLTIANIFKRKHIENTRVSDLLKEDLRSWENSEYILIIKSQTSNCLKLTFYPVKNKIITKITIFGQKFTNNQINKIIEIIKDLNIIHTSGLTAKEDKFFYELYLDLNLSEAEDFYNKNFEKSLKKLKESEKNIRIEEIKINKELYEK